MRAPERMASVVARLWVAVIVFSLAYVPGFLFLYPAPVLPALGGHVAWIITAWIMYLLILGVLWMVAWLGSGQRAAGAEPAFGPLVPSRCARRTGIPGTDRIGFVVSVLAAILCVKSAFWFPWLAVVAAVFGLSAFFVAPEPWPTSPRRDIPELPPPGPIDPNEETVERSWKWTCRGRSLTSTVDLKVRTKAVKSRQATNPSQGGLSVKDWENVVHHLTEEGSKDHESIEAARQLLAFARAQRFNYFEEAQNTLQLVQVIPYQTDHQSKGAEYFRYAIETFYDDNGDCDCKAILAATLFRLMGLRSVVLLSADEQHAAVAVEGAPDFPGNRYFEWAGGHFYFCETTDGSFGFTVGEVPPSVNLDTYSVRVGIEPQLLGA